MSHVIAVFCIPADSCTAGVQTFFYAAPFSHQVWLVYAANSIAGGDDCNVASIVVESIPNIDETGDDDEVENSLEPMSLADLMTELVQNRGGLAATDWQATDAEAIDTASGYAGQGYHSRDQVTIRKAVDDVLTGYTASIYLDRSGKLRVMRLVAPEDETGVSSLTDDDMLTPPLPEWDDGAGLTRSLGARRNERVLTDSDLVTDDLDVTIRLRRKLAREHRYICVTGDAACARLRARRRCRPGWHAPCRARRRTGGNRSHLRHLRQVASVLPMQGRRTL
jgi:hypothetical protein